MGDLLIKRTPQETSLNFSYIYLARSWPFQGLHYYLARQASPLLIRLFFQIFKKSLDGYMAVVKLLGHGVRIFTRFRFNIWGNNSAFLRYKNSLRAMSVTFLVKNQHCLSKINSKVAMLSTQNELIPFCR
jgi:hypothetical protein